MNRDPAHYLKPLKGTRVPKRLAYFDVQTQSRQRGKNRELSWLCGTLATSHVAGKSGSRKDVMRTFWDPASMWTTLDKFCVGGKRVVLWTYDLPEQLRTSQAMIHLPGMGWHLETVVLEPGAAWALWRDGKRSLLMCDLKSWTPYEWERISEAMHDARGNGDDPPHGLDRMEFMSWNRCRTIKAAVTQILTWIEVEGLGGFKPTGSGQSYSAYRRRWLSDRILVHDDIPRLRAERRSMWSGRVEAWQHGRLVGGPFLELDMRAAYSRIAASCKVPTVAIGDMYQPTVEKVLKACDRYAFLCQVKVRTEVPCAPVDTGTHTIWPVGDYETWVWDPELRLLNIHADEISITKAYRYRTASALSGFAGHVLETLDTRNYDYGPMPYFVQKHWSRTLVGRFGLRYRSWIPFADNDESELSMVTFIDYDDHTMTDMLCVGTDMLLLGELTESVESVPQIPAWIMSECRRRLFTTMCEIGLDRIVYVDTDSMIIDLQGDRQYGRELARHYRDVWAVKASYRSMHIYGPRNIRIDTDRRVSGLPNGASETGEGRFNGEVMRSIRESMRHGQLSTVTTSNRTFTFDAPDIRRRHGAGNQTEPFRVGGDPATDDRQPTTKH